VMATKRIPYPARALDMAHCSRCLIPWNKLGKVLLCHYSFYGFLITLLLTQMK
jgi:hypothetical protein